MGTGFRGRRWLWPAAVLLIAWGLPAVGAAGAGKADALERWSRVASGPCRGRTDPVKAAAAGWIRFFQRFVSPVDGPSCTFLPTCSAYGLQAVEKHGLLGIPMAAERVMRNHRPDDPARYPLREVNGHFYYWDPVESNDFWWSHRP